VQKVKFGNGIQNGPPKHVIIGNLSAANHDIDAEKISRELTAKQVRVLKMAYDVDVTRMTEEEIAKLPVQVLNAILYRYGRWPFPKSKKEVLVHEVFKLNEPAYAAAKRQMELRREQLNRIDMGPILNIAAKNLSLHDQLVVANMTGDIQIHRRVGAQLKPTEVIVYENGAPKEPQAVSSMTDEQLSLLLDSANAWVMRSDLIEVSRNVFPSRGTRDAVDPSIVIRLRTTPYAKLYYFKPLRSASSIRTLMVETQTYRNPPLSPDKYKEELMYLGYGLNWLKKWTRFNPYVRAPGHQPRFIDAPLDDAGFLARNAMDPAAKEAFDDAMAAVRQSWFKDMKKLFNGTMQQTTGRPRPTQSRQEKAQ